MATVVDNKYNISFCVHLGSFFMSFSNIQWLWREYAIGHKTPQDLFSLYVGVLRPLMEFGSLLDAYGVRFAFGVTILLLLLAPAIIVLSIIQLWDSVRQPNVFFLLCLFSYDKQLYNLTLLYYTLPQILLVLPPSFLERVKLITLIVSLLGVGLYNGFTKYCTSPLVFNTFLSADHIV
ncbi:Folate-biopterin transporter 1, chloroplastic, partial [Mucuna pruriens]